MKSGWQTTEFWASALVTIGSLIAALTGHLDAGWAAIASAIAGGLYATGRGLAKASGGVSDETLRQMVEDVLSDAQGGAGDAAGAGGLHQFGANAAGRNGVSPQRPGGPNGGQ